MECQVSTVERPTATDRSGTVHVLRVGKAQAEIWPALGFNCFSWRLEHSGRRLDLLYADPELFQNGRPSRSGIPILFPFPNRIRNGHFAWDGKEYQLPLNDSTSTHAIHGFACRKPWRMIDQGAGQDHAWLTGQFRGSVDAPESLAQWPADYQITVTYRLQEQKLAALCVIENPDRKPLPMGFGFHPYFKIPFVSGSKPESYITQVKARRYWELKDMLPTGKRLPVDVRRDLNIPRKVSELELDDVLTDGPDTLVATGDGLCILGRIRDVDAGVELQVRGTRDFRENVLFTPSHREAFCIEPYTCTTDAINLHARGIEGGLHVLAPGQSCKSTMLLAVE